MIELLNFESYNIWSGIYIIFNLFAFILLIIGIILLIIYSGLPWFIWIILGTATFLFLLSNLILNIFPNDVYISGILFIFSIILFITSLILTPFYINSPWWVWLIFIIVILLAIFSYVFEIFSVKNVKALRNNNIVSECENLTIPIF